MDDRSNRVAISGFRLTERARVTELGTWIDAIGKDGRRAGALRFDPRVSARPGVRDRLVATVLTDRRLAQGGLTGLVPIADLVTTGEELWLLTPHQVTPVLSELMTSPVVDASSAAAVLVETAQTLLAVHAAGLAHGAVHPGTIVIADDGAALLCERGLADAIRGQTPSPSQDVMAWAALARGMAASWGKRTPRAAELLERAAFTATTHGLAAARDTVLGGREALPGGLVSREVLAEIARRWSALDVATQGMAAQDEGDIVTLLHVPEVGPRFGTGVATEPPRAVPATTPPHAVAAESTAERIWREGREQAPASPRAGRAQRVARARKRRTVVSTAIFALVLAGALIAWFRLGSTPPLVVQSVQVSAPKKTVGCDKTVTISGKLTTNGSPGTIDYEWVQSDTKEVTRQSATVQSGTTKRTVVLKWTVKGKSTFKGTATLRVLSPVAAGARVEGKASFRYKC